MSQHSGESRGLKRSWDAYSDDLHSGDDLNSNVPNAAWVTRSVPHDPPYLQELPRERTNGPAHRHMPADTSQTQLNINTLSVPSTYWQTQPFSHVPEYPEQLSASHQDGVLSYPCFSNSERPSMGHYYGGAVVSGYANVQMGDQHNHYGPGSMLHGQTLVRGNMTVNHSHYTIYQQPNRLAPHAADFELKKALYYDGMDARKAQLDIVDPASLEWIWLQTSFPQWLESDDGFYLITGKPASGKSTLLNHLTRRDRQRVITILKRKNPDPLLLAFFFDFRSGSGMANSLVGLLRSLLLQLIEASTHVKNYCSQNYGYRSPGHWLVDQNQLCKMLIDSLHGEDRLICGMIDGLDEYEGDLSELLKMLHTIRGSTRIKVCLASRPDTRILQHFGSASFKMEDHNTATISAYIQAAFSSLQLAQIFLPEENLKFLKKSIQYLANGVVLWVKFAVGEVLNALHYGHKPETAISLLRGLPTDLAGIYDRILSRLSAEQKTEACVILFLIRYWWTDQNSIPLDELMPVYSTIMIRVYHQATGFCFEEDLRRFRIRLYNLLGGLVDLFPFGEDGIRTEVRLAHQSLETFLRSNHDFLQCEAEIDLIVKRDCLNHEILAQIVAAASDSIDRDLVSETEGGMNLMLGLPRVPRRTCSAFTVYTGYALYSASLLSESPVVHECQNCAGLLLQIEHSWMFQLSTSRTQADMQRLFRQMFPALSKNVWKLWRYHPETFKLMFWGQALALRILFEQNPGDFSDEVRDELQRYAKKEHRKRHGLCSESESESDGESKVYGDSDEGVDTDIDGYTDKDANEDEGEDSDRDDYENEERNRAFS